MTFSDLRNITMLLKSQLDLFTIRFIMMLGSFIWAISSLYPASSFHRHGFEFLKYLAPEEIWGFAFLAHAVAVLWRLLEVKSRYICSLVISTFGFSLWAYTTASINLALGAISPSSSMSWAMCIMSFYCLVRTGLKKEVVTL